MNNDIIADTENIDRVVRQFAEDLDGYLAKVDEGLTAFSRAVVELGEGWQSEDYDRFAENMRNRVSKIKAELSRAKELQSYLNETAEQFSQLLKIFSQAAEE